MFQTKVVEKIKTHILRTYKKNPKFAPFMSKHEKKTSSVYDCTVEDVE